MTRPLIVLRPEPGNAATTAAARDMGLETVPCPLFEIGPVEWQAPAPQGFSGLLAGSANVFRLGGPALASLRELPVHAVGAATAQAAQTAVFTVTFTGIGGLQPLVEGLAPGRYLRLAGAEHVPLLPPPGVEIETRVVYAAHALPLSPKAAMALEDGAVALFHSGEAARHFAAECERLELPRSAIALACLAPRIADLAGAGWRTVRIADERTDPALLALARAMCQTVWPMGHK
ncbi:MAG: uroporphyrinogen-III synthase [Novosphingobium sp. 12-64-8]|nr:MAG: uroporphyrinogen-III synthase [Novosphingobium sp. 12-64-8]